MKHPIKLSVIGAKGAGKTTLMAAYSAVCSNVGGTDDTSRKFFEDQNKAWDNNKWPDPTKDENVINIRIGRKGGNDVVVSFAEYMGESFSKDADYLDRIVGKPDIAMFLVNPLMSDFSDTGKRAGLEVDAKKVIDHLVGKPGEKTTVKERPVLALVWTASDTDTAESEDFKSFTKHLRKYVGDRLQCEEFSVTLFGKMEDESVPPGRPGDPEKNTSPKPFEWALGIVESRRIAEKWKKRLRIMAFVGIAALIAFPVGFGIQKGCLRVAEKGRLDRLEKRFDSIGKAPADNAIPDELVKWEEKWTRATNNATELTRPALLSLKGEFERSLPEWKRSQLLKDVEDIYTKLASVTFSLDMRDTVIASFQKSYLQAIQLEESRAKDYSEISESDFALMTEMLRKARESCKDRFRSCFSSQPGKALDTSVIEKVWKPVFLDNKEYTQYLQSIQNPVRNTMEESANLECSSLYTIRDDPYAVAQKCKSWYNKNRDNPYRKRVVDSALTRIGEWMENFASFSAPTNYKRKASSKTTLDRYIQRLHSDFDKFKAVCSELETAFWDDYPNEWPVCLARECAKAPWFSSAGKFSTAFPQTLTLSKVEVIWQENDHQWDSAFKGWTISFQIVNRPHEGKDDFRYEGLKDSANYKKVTLTKKRPNFGAPKTIWPLKGQSSRSEVVYLGDQLVIKIRIREVMYSGVKWLVGDEVIDYEIPLCTDELGAILESKNGVLEKSYPIFIDNLKGTKDTKSTLVIRFYVASDGKSLGGLIKETREKRGRK